MSTDSILSDLYSLLDGKDVEMTTSKCREFIEFGMSIGSYDKYSWNENLCMTVYNLCKKISRKCPDIFIEALNRKLGERIDNYEFLVFFRLELMINLLGVLELKGAIRDALHRYPRNLEFRHMWGQFLSAKENYVESLRQYEYCLTNNPSEFFKKSLINAHVEQINRFLHLGSVEEAKLLVQSINEAGFYHADHVYNNVIASMSSRIMDHEIISRKIEEGLQRFDDHVEIKMAQERGRLVETLAIFSAVIGFIFSSVTASQNFDFGEVVNLTAFIGFVIITFVVSASLVGRAGSISLKDPRLIILVVSVFGLLSLLWILQ